MTIRNLEGLFTPRSLAVIGPNALSVPAFTLLLTRLKGGGFTGRMTLVDGPASSPAPEGFHVAASLQDMAAAPDLVIFIGDPARAPECITQAGEKGAKVFAALSCGYNPWPNELVQQCLIASAPYRLRILGPGSLGVAMPHANLQANLAAAPVSKGDLALIARSGGVLNATLVWAKAKGIGFSGVVSLAQRADVDISDLLDSFALDYRTRAILVHLETIVSPKKFLSAARAASRVKPVIVMRSGWSLDPTGEGETHAGRLAPLDKVFDVALQRAGILRVDDLGELFGAAETLTRLTQPRGKKLCILSNGRTLATLAMETLIKNGGDLAQLSDETEELISAFSSRPRRKTHTAPRPVTLPEDSSPETYETIIKALISDPNADGVMLLFAPTAFSSQDDNARAIARAVNSLKSPSLRKKPLIVIFPAMETCAKETLDQARIPSYASTAEAVEAFMHLIHYGQAQAHLMAAPPALPAGFAPDVQTARTLVHAALQKGRTWLSPQDVDRLLDCYAIPRALGEVGDAPPCGQENQTLEAFAGLANDPTFGPVVLFGQGGQDIETIHDIAMELPPLDLKLARAMIEKTRIHRIIKERSSQPATNLDDLALTLIKISQLSIDIPEILELDVNPLISGPQGISVQCARIVLQPSASRLTIAPYPNEWEQTWRLKDGSEAFIRPVKPEDEELYRQFFTRIEPEDLRLRFFAPVKTFTHGFLARLVQLDYSRAMAFAALDPQTNEFLGVVRLHADPDHRTGEYAILVRSNLKGLGLGWMLMRLIISYAAKDGIETIKGEVLRENTTMLAMCKALGFQVKASPDDNAIVEVTLPTSGLNASNLIEPPSHGAT